MQEVKSEVQEIVEELPEDADLSTDPGHLEQFVSESSSEATPSPVNVTPSPSPAIPTPQPSKESSLGPEPVVVPVAGGSDFGPPPVSIPDDRDRDPTPETPVPDTVLSLVSEIQSPVPETLPSPISEIQSPVPEFDQESGKAESKSDPAGREDGASLSSELSGLGVDKAGKKEEHKYATLSRVRKFKVDGQVMQSTTRKIVDVTANKTLRDNKKYQQMR